MAFKIIFLEEFGKAFVPNTAIPHLRKYMLKAGYSEVPYKFFGLLFYVSAMCTALLFVTTIYPYLKKFTLLKIYSYSFLGWFLVQFSFAITFILLIYFYLDLKIYHRTKKMEEQLTDFLQVVSANLKGGMTFERALWAAIKPRFNVLGPDMARVSKKVMTGYEVGKALAELADKYNSPMLRRTVDLMISEVESGGNVAKIIDRIVDNLKETKALKDEMSGAAIAYVMFISLIVVVISPLLFALSSHLLTIIVSFIGKLAATTRGGETLPLSFSEVNVNPRDFKIFSITTIAVISFFSSMIVSIVEKGDIKGGVKYIPLFMGGSMLLYFLFTNLIQRLFAVGF